MQRIFAVFVIGSACLLSGDRMGADEPPQPPLSPQQTTQLGELLERDWENRPPWAVMATNILKGDPMGSGKGWFTGSSRRHNWQWLADRYSDAAEDERIEADEIPELTQAEFVRVDQNRDRAITPADFVFDKNPLMEDDSPAGSIFARLDDDSNGRLTMNELERWFKRSSDGSDFLSVDDLKDALGLAPRPSKPSDGSAKERKDPRWEMLGMLLNGEMGSLTEGPEVGQDAPELNLPLVARNEEAGGLELTDRIIRLESFRGKKPVVLIFGSFT